jgi:hypothetical protein
LTKAVVKLMEQLGWRVVHFKPAQGQRGEWRTPMLGIHAAGFPDLLALRRERGVVVELKVSGRKPRPEQHAWLTAFEDAGFDSFFWNETDWRDGTMDRELR